MAQINIPRLPAAQEEYSKEQINQMIQTLDQLIQLLNSSYTPEQLKNEDSISELLQEELEELASVTSVEGQDPETLRREALRKMTDLQKKLDELMQDENALTFEEVSKRL